MKSPFRIVFLLASVLALALTALWNPALANRPMLSQAEKLLAEDQGKSDRMLIEDGGIREFALYDLNGDGQPELLTRGIYGTEFSVYGLSGDAPALLWEWDWIYSNLDILEDSVLFVENTAHQTHTFAFYQMTEDGEIILLDYLESTCISENYTDCRNQDAPISEAELDAILSGYVSRKLSDQAVRWWLNDGENLSVAFSAWKKSEI